MSKKFTLWLIFCSSITKRTLTFENENTLNAKLPKDDILTDFIDYNRPFSDFHNMYLSMDKKINYGKSSERIDEHKKSDNVNTSQTHSRQKRLIWITDDGRLVIILCYY